MYKGFKVEILPTNKQQIILNQYADTAHKMWNYVVEKFQNDKIVLSPNGIKGYTDNNLISDLCLENFPKRIARGVLKTYNFAMRQFFNNMANCPKFHKYNPRKKSFYIIDIEYKIYNYHYIQLPIIGSSTISKKIYINSNIFEKDKVLYVHDVRYTFLHNKWYLSGCYLIEDVDIILDKEILGLDWGIKNFMTDSEGNVYNYPKTVLRLYNHIKKLQHYLDKKQYMSKNYIKLLKKIKYIYLKMDNIKNNFIHQTTTLIARKYHISIENLTGFIHDLRIYHKIRMIYPYYKFIEILEWKCKKYGSLFIKVSPAFTTQTCCRCGSLHDMPLKKRIMLCRCGNIMDRDMNAAVNIKNNAKSVMNACHI